MANRPSSLIFFFNDTATTEIYPLSLHDALPIYRNHAATVKSVAGTEIGGAVIRSPPVKCLARPTFPAMSVVPVIVPGFAHPARYFIFPSHRRGCVSYIRAGPPAGGGAARAGGSP